MRPTSKAKSSDNSLHFRSSAAKLFKPRAASGPLSTEVASRGNFLLAHYLSKCGDHTAPSNVNFS
eukprot:328144-Amphidinium_carterae.1